MKKQWKSLFDYYGFTKKETKEYPVVSKILKQLTPERIKKEIEEIQKVKLPPELQKWVKEYEDVGERDEFIWKWLYKMFKVVYLPIIQLNYQESLTRSKTLITMFVCQLDDITDKKKNKALFNELLKIPLEQKYIKREHLNNKDKKYLSFTKKLWNYIIKQIKKYPKYKKLEEVFYYDVAQVLNVMKYSYLLNRHLYLLNERECWQFMPYNMVSFIYSDLDLMCAKNISNSERIAQIREIIFEAQKMARIGNWVSTWERELEESDFSNGIIAYAVESGILSFRDLNQRNILKIVKKIKQDGIEKNFLKKWEESYNKIKKNTKKDKKENFTNRFLSKMERLLIFHLSSRGYK